MHRAVGEHHVGAAEVEAVDLMVVGAVERTGPWPCLPIGLRALNRECVIESCPAAAVDRLVWARPAQAPDPGPAGTLGHQDGVRGTVGDVSQRRQEVLHDAPLITVNPPHTALSRQNGSNSFGGGAAPTSALAAVR